MIRRPPRSPLFPYTTLSRSFRLMYELRFDEALKEIAAYRRARPDEPLGVAAEAASHLFEEFDQDRKSTRLNSSHLVISYAVFCLKKKTNTTSPHSVTITRTH